MTWGMPAAAWALLALAVPVLIHTLVRRRSTPTPFPTLRFIPHTRLASIERRALEEVGLLTVRLGVLAAGAAAVAAPFVVTNARRAGWDSVTVRVEVAVGVPPRGGANTSIAAETVDRGVAQALVWFDSQQPGRRELIVRSAFRIGSISAADLAAIPPNVGVRLERAGELPASRRFPAPPVLTRDEAGSVIRLQRETMLDRDRTSVQDTGTAEKANAPIEILAPPARQRSADDVVRSVLAGRVPAPSGSRSVRIELVDGLAAKTKPAVDGINVPWMADAAAVVWRDMVLRSPARVGLQMLADGTHLVVRADSGIADSVLAALVRSVLESIAPPLDQRREEVLTITNAQLNSWSREPGPPDIPGAQQRPWDGRWFWLVALVLLALEAVVRRRSTRSDRDAASAGEQARVA
jgi:hypothetical protein